ncbi:MAG TPA: hypothetical protein VGL93_35085 [Streptosporangiaceae bacterium]|jgi:hypothetical protein
MSEYPGPDHTGWPATTGQQPQDTYGGPAYEVAPAQVYPPGGYPPPYAYGYGYHPDPGARGGAIAALITGCIAIVVCVGLLAVPTAILGGVALSRADTDPASARRLTKWAWIALGIGAGLMLLLFVGYIVLMIVIAGNAASDSY